MAGSVLLVKGVVKMTITMNEIKEINEIKAQDSPLGKMTEATIVNKEILDIKIVKLELYKNCPINDGKWEENRGDSKWMPSPEYIPLKSNMDNKSWSEILNKHNIDGVCFKDGEPDFSEISKGNVEIKDYSKFRTDNFDKADIELSLQKGCSPEEVSIWRKENQYTWHECKDMLTMQKVPSIIHNNISHRGGISAVKELM